MPCLKSLIPNISSGATRSIRDSDLRLRACGICASEIYFLNFLENKGEKDWSDAQPDSAIQPKARGLLHMEREYFAHHMCSRFQGLSTSQPRSKLKYLKDYSTYLKEGPEATRTRLRRARGLVRPGAAGLIIDIEYSRVRNSSWMYLTSFVITRIGVGLIAVQQNYPIVL